MIRTLKTLGTEGSSLNIRKALYDKLRTKVIVIWAKLTEFPLRSGTKGEHPFLPL